MKAIILLFALASCACTAKTVSKTEPPATTAEQEPPRLCTYTVHADMAVTTDVSQVAIVACHDNDEFVEGECLFFDSAPSKNHPPLNQETDDGRGWQCGTLADPLVPFGYVRTQATCSGACEGQQ